MKLFYTQNIFYKIIFLLIYFPQLILSQNLDNRIILFERKTLEGIRQIYFADNSIKFKVDNLVVLSVPVNEMNFNLINSIDGHAFGVINYFYGKKSEKTILEIYLIDDTFKITFYKKLSFNYEEPLPKFLQLSDTELILLIPATGILKIFNLNSEREFQLLKDEENEFFQERIGHLLFHEGQLIVTLSQIKKGGDLSSVIFTIDLRNLELNRLSTGIDIIYKTFKVDDKIYFTGLDTEPFFQSGFYSLELNKNNFSESVVSKISDVLIDGKIKGTEDTFFSRECFFKLNKEQLTKLDLCFENENIIDALMLDNKFYILTRKELTTNFYEVNSNFKIIEKKSIERFLSNPELFIYPQKAIMIRDKNKIILEKNISEE
ncbi:MAG: hypothetical protein ACK4G1_05120 [Ignavibacteria bacterium]